MKEIQWTGLLWVAVLPEGVITDRDLDSIKSRVEKRGYAYTVREHIL